MRHSPRNRSFSKSLRTALVAALVILGVYDAMLLQAVLACPGPDGPTYPGTEAYASTITLQMPFIAGETWTVGEMAHLDLDTPPPRFMYNGFVRERLPL